MAILKDLIVHGSSRFLNKIYASEILTSLIEAEAGVFKKLKADDATVVGLLDVKGLLHTNSWSNSNLATIDGSFYITPTIGSASGTVTVTASSLVFSGTNYAVSSLYLGDGSSITWPQYSKVLVTGLILSNGEWIPLGTLLGQLNSTATAASISVNNIKDNKNQTSNVLATLVSNGTTSSSYRNLKVSLYQRAGSSTAFYPLGIYMTATGTNGRTFLDIYGGVEALSNSNNYGGFAEPNVRIGNLLGLPNVGGQTPSGWGIYTDNGYFKGIIAADKGYIGSGSKYWVIANEEDLSNSENSRSYIYNGTNNIASTVEGVYLGTDGIRNYKDSTHNVTIKDGVITALGVDLSGKIIATSGTIGGASITNGTLIVSNANINDINASKINAGDIAAARIQTNLISAINAKVSDLSTLTATIGGFQIDSSSIHTKSVAITSNADNSIALSSADFTRTINSTSRTGLRFAIGDKFGITGDGTIYASNVDLTGKIIATSGTIGGIEIENGALKVSSINIGNLGGASNYAKKTDVTLAIDNIEIGGRNLLKNSNVVLNDITTGYMVGGITTLTLPTGTQITLSVQVDADEVTWSSGNRVRIGLASSIAKEDGSGNQYLEVWAAKTGRSGVGIANTFNTSFHGRIKYTYILEGELIVGKNFGLHIQDVTSGTIQISKAKLEIGNKATDWTPAPEDVEIDIEEAKKVATNYLSMDSTGIMIADMNDGEQTPSTATGKNVFIDNDSVDIRNGQQVLASFSNNNVNFYETSLNKDVANFGADGVRVGSEEEQHFIINKDSIKAVNGDGSPLFSIDTTAESMDNVVKLTDGTIVSGSGGFSIDIPDLDVDDKIYIESLYITATMDKFNNPPVYQYEQASGYNIAKAQYRYSDQLVGTYPRVIKTEGSTKTISVDLCSVDFIHALNSTTYKQFVIFCSFKNDYGVWHNYSLQLSLRYTTSDGNSIYISGISNYSAPTYTYTNDNYQTSEYHSQVNFKLYVGTIFKMSTSRAPSMTFGTRNGEDGMLSSVFGQGLYAEKSGEFVIGRFNEQELQTESKYAFVVGNGETEEYRSNALTIDWSGNICFGVDVAGSETDAELVTAIESAGWDDDVYDD